MLLLPSNLSILRETDLIEQLHDVDPDRLFLLGVGTRGVRNRTQLLSTKDSKYVAICTFHAILRSASKGVILSEMMLAMLSNIRTVEDMVAAFRDEERCRRLLESMVWPNGRICPSCGYKRSTAIAGRHMDKRRARAGLYQCSSGECRFQFTVTTHTPLHATKLPLRTWLKAMWLLLQSDKGLSSVRLAETLGVSQPTAWRIGHALRLMVAREHMLDGTVEVDLSWWQSDKTSR
jgi:transposase-like protein